MTTKSEFKLVDDAVSDDPYDLGRLRIDPEKLETAATKKLLTSVPVKKPNSRLPETCRSIGTSRTGARAQTSGAVKPAND